MDNTYRDVRLAMLQKRWKTLGLLLALIYFYVACPILCSGFGSKLCCSASKSLGHAQPMAASCCQRVNTEMPLEDRDLRCQTDLVFVFPDNTDGPVDLRELSAGYLVAVVPRTVMLPAAVIDHLFLPLSPSLSLYPLRYILTRRGPPPPLMPR